MAGHRVLVANRGEIAIRIMRTAAELGIETVAVYAEDDAGSLHPYKADAAFALKGAGVGAYLDGEQIVRLALESGCDAIHPGYGFLSESAAFAEQCAAAGIAFVGPTADTLRLFGDKATARAVAGVAGVPVLEGSVEPVTMEEAVECLEALGEGGAIAIKAVAGGGGRGIRIVSEVAEVAEAYERCRSEALAAFGNGSLYVERAVRDARHIEVQVAGDATGEFTHFGERECSLQRRHQKLVEVAPSPTLDPAMREEMTAAAVAIAKEAGLTNLATFEFLLEAGGPGSFHFIETNPRLQVEHTVTEEVMGVDLVRVQLLLAYGETLAGLGLRQADVGAPRGFAIQARVNMETMQADGSVRPAMGTLTRYEPPSGLGVRTDGAGYTGYSASPAYDSLLAKVIAHSTSGTFGDAVVRLGRALSEFAVEGVATNLPFIRALLEQPAVRAGTVTTRFIDEHVVEVVERAAAIAAAGTSGPAGRPAGGASAAVASNVVSGPEGSVALAAPLTGTVIALLVAAGDPVRQGQLVAVVEAMKMEHEVRAAVSGVVAQVVAAVKETVAEGSPLVFVLESADDDAGMGAGEVLDATRVRPDLQAVLDRRARLRDATRPSYVSRRHAAGGRTARENVADLCGDEFVEYGQLVLAAQEHRYSTEELIERSPADGLVVGIGSINGDLFEAPASECVVIAHDATVFAGTQGRLGMAKISRMMDIANEGRLPVVVYAEGGGARSGDNEGLGNAATALWTRASQLSGLVPLVGVVNGKCFAGNAGLLGVCDVIIATRDSNLGMGGPAMVEGGGLGVVAPEDIGPSSVQGPNGVIDVLVEDEAEATVVAKQYLSYFQGRVSTWECADQRLLRAAVPESRVRGYSIHALVALLADTGSMLELRPQFGRTILTALIRVEGRPVGVMANNPLVLSGALDSDGADKASRFMQLCDAFDLPILSLCDTPGTMVGPETEKTAILRHSSRMFLVGSNLTVPVLEITLRKRTGLGAAAMQPPALFNVSWPTGEFARMNIEGSVKLARRAELAAIEDEDERKRHYDAIVASEYEVWSAMRRAQSFAFDEIIDPAESRTWITRILGSLRTAPRTGKKRPYIDAW